MFAINRFSDLNRGMKRPRSWWIAEDRNVCLGRCFADARSGVVDPLGEANRG